MHELSIIQNLVSIVEQEWNKQAVPGARLCLVRMAVGAEHQVIDESLQVAFRACVSDTPFADAQLEIEHIPAKGRCRACGWEGVITIPFFHCARCMGKDIERLSGNELYLASLEVEHGANDDQNIP